MKCVNCKHCVNYCEGYYWCDLLDDIELIEECVANDDNLGCDGYDEDSNDNFTQGQGKHRGSILTPMDA